MNTATTPIQTRSGRRSQPLDDTSNNDNTSSPQRLDRRLARSERESGSRRLGGALGNFGGISLSVIQFMVWAVAVVVMIPVALNMFLGFEFNRVLTGSMEPTIMTNDLVVTRPPVGGELHKGAIVSINYGMDSSYTHRVISVKDDGTAVTQGDNNNTPDLFKPTEEDLVGVVINVIHQPFAGVLSSFTTTPEWRTQAFNAIRGEGDIAALTDEAPWGFLALVGALLLFTWVIPDLITYLQKRAERRANERLEALTETVDSHDESITEIEPVVQEIKAERAADLEARVGVEGQFWNALESADDTIPFDTELEPVVEVPTNPFEAKARQTRRATRSAFELADD